VREVSDAAQSVVRRVRLDKRGLAAVEVAPEYQERDRAGSSDQDAREDRGEQELAEAERVELRTRDRYDAARARLNQLLAEFQAIDDEGRGRRLPPGW
jgi:hypothetical protein